MTEETGRRPGEAYMADLPRPSTFLEGDLLTENFRQPRVLVIHWFRL
jgi:hypothetical protein